MDSCEKCKFWNREYSNYEVGNCKNAVQFWDASEWGDDYESRKISEKYTKNGAFVQDGSDYRAVLLTRPDFFCRDFEEK